MMEESLFAEIMDGLDYKYFTIVQVHAKCLNVSISYTQAEQFLYSLGLGRHNKFELFLALYDATLKRDPVTAFQVFREAYCSSDNIHNQILNCKILAFDLKVFLKDIHRDLKAKGMNFLSLMNANEKVYYEGLARHFKIYRGLSITEHLSGNYGISWTLSKQTAEKYAYFRPNNVPKGQGMVRSKKIDKQDVLAVFCVHEDYEIIYLMK